MSIVGLSKIIERNAESLSKKRNVVAVAAGKKWVDGKPSDQDAIIILVEKKESLSTLDSSDVIPRIVEGIITDVVGKTGIFEAQSYTRKERPAPAGISCGHPGVTAGTIGGYFHDGPGKMVMLSNNHVIANQNNARIGDLISQPGRRDGGQSNDRIGYLRRFKTLRTINREDSAIASVVPNLVQDQIKTIGRIKGFNLRPYIGMRVQKVGRTTEKTSGRIVGLHATVYVRYRTSTLRFVDQIITTGMSKGGDSGSLLLDSSNRVVGLLFAGSSTMTIHNYIKYPISTYGLKVIGFKPVRRQSRRVIRLRSRRRRVRRLRGRTSRPARRRPRRSRRVRTRPRVRRRSYRSSYRARRRRYSYRRRYSRRYNRSRSYAIGGVVCARSD